MVTKWMEEKGFLLIVDDFCILYLISLFFTVDLWLFCMLVKHLNILDLHIYKELHLS